MLFRSGFSPTSEIGYLEARLSAFRVARAKGYDGDPILGDGVEIGTSDVFKYEYLGGDVVHLRGFEFHGLNSFQEDFIGEFLSTWPSGETPCPGDFNDDRAIDGGDLGLMFAGWASADFDLNGDGTLFRTFDERVQARRVLNVCERLLGGVVTWWQPGGGDVATPIRSNPKVSITASVLAACMHDRPCTQKCM